MSVDSFVDCLIFAFLFDRNKDSNWLKGHIRFLEKRNSSEMTLDYMSRRKQNLLHEEIVFLAANYGAKILFYYFASL